MTKVRASTLADTIKRLAEQWEAQAEACRTWAAAERLRLNDETVPRVALIPVARMEGQYDTYRRCAHELKALL